MVGAVAAVVGAVGTVMTWLEFYLCARQLYLLMLLNMEITSVTGRMVVAMLEISEWTAVEALSNVDRTPTKTELFESAEIWPDYEFPEVEEAA